MKKKIVSLLVVTALLISSAACGKKEVNDIKTDSVSTEDSVAEEVKPQQADEEVKQVSDLVTVLLSPVEYNQNYSSDCYAKVRFDTINIEDKERYPKLYDSLTQYNTAQNESYEKQYSEFQDEVEEFMGFDNDYGFSEFIDSNVRVVRNYDNIFSFWEDSYIYTGGAHGMPTNVGNNYDIASGEKITWDMVAKDNDKILDAMVDYLKNNEADRWAEIMETDYLTPLDGDDSDSDTESLVRSTLEDLMNSGYFKDSFCLGADGVHIYIASYILGPYALGSFEVVVPYDKADAVNDAYASKSVLEVLTCDDITIRVLERAEDENGFNFGSPNTPGETWAIAQRDEYDQYILTVGVGDCILYTEEYSLGFDVRVFEAHTQTEGVYVLVERLCENDYRTIQTISMNGISRFTGYGFYDNVPDSMDNFKVCGRSNSISTFFYTAEGTIYNGDISIYGELEIIGDWEFTAMIDITAHKDYYMDEDSFVIKKGTKFKAIADSEDFSVKVRTEDGQEGWIVYTKDQDYRTLVEGVDLYEAIDGVIFAG